MEQDVSCVCQESMQIPKGDLVVQNVQLADISLEWDMKAALLVRQAFS